MTRDKNETKVGKQSANLGKNNEPIQNRLSFLIDCKSVTLHHFTILSFPMVRPTWDNGGISQIKAVTLPRFCFEAAGSTVTLHDTEVIKNTESDNHLFSGSLGADFVLSFKRLVINYQDMFIRGE